MLFKQREEGNTPGHERIRLHRYRHTSGVQQFNLTDGSWALKPPTLPDAGISRIQSGRAARYKL